MSSDTAETVKRARELLDSGIDPIVLMSQLATLIMDIIAGTHPSIDAKPTDSSFVGKCCKCCFHASTFFTQVSFPHQTNC